MTMDETPTARERIASAQAVPTRRPYRDRIRHVAIDAIARPTTPVRSTIDPTAVRDLRVSLGQVGLIQLPGVRRLGRHRYELLWGQTRLLAARAAGWETIEVVLLEGVDDCAALVLGVTENTARRELPDVDKVRVVAAFKAFGLTGEGDRREDRHQRERHQPPGADRRAHASLARGRMRRHRRGRGAGVARRRGHVGGQPDRRDRPTARRCCPVARRGGTPSARRGGARQGPGPGPHATRRDARGRASAEGGRAARPRARPEHRQAGARGRAVALGRRRAQRARGAQCQAGAGVAALARSRPAPSAAAFATPT